MGKEGVDCTSSIQAMPQSGSGGAHPPSVKRSFSMMNDRGWDNANLMACSPYSPAQVEVVTVEGQCSIEAAQGLPDIASNEHAAAPHRMHLAAGIVLSLIVLTCVQIGEPATGPGDSESHLKE